MDSYVAYSAYTHWIFTRGMLVILIVSVTNHQSSDWLSQAQQIRKRLSHKLAVIPRHKYYIHITLTINLYRSSYRLWILPLSPTDTCLILLSPRCLERWSIFLQKRFTQGSSAEYYASQSKLQVKEIQDICLILVSPRFLERLLISFQNQFIQGSSAEYQANHS